MNNVVNFTPKLRARIILDGGTTHDGRLYYWIELDDGDIRANVWDGSSYHAALEAAVWWQADGLRLIDKIGGADA